MGGSPAIPAGYAPQSISAAATGSWMSFKAILRSRCRIGLDDEADGACNAARLMAPPLNDSPDTARASAQ
jgi:hypothetical protein